MGNPTKKCSDCAYATVEDYSEYEEHTTCFGLVSTYKARTVQGWVCRWSPDVRKVKPDGWCWQYKIFDGKEPTNG